MVLTTIVRRRNDLSTATTTKNNTSTATIGSTAATTTTYDDEEHKNNCVDNDNKKKVLAYDDYDDDDCDTVVTIDGDDSDISNATMTATTTTNSNSNSTNNESTNSDTNATTNATTTTSSSSLRKIISLGKNEYKMILFSIVIMISSEVTSTFIPYLYGKAFDEVIHVTTTTTTTTARTLTANDIIDNTEQQHRNNNEMSSINSIMILILIVHGTFVLLASIRIVLMSVISERIVARLRLKLYQNILIQDVSFFDNIQSGELLSRLSIDTSLLQNTSCQAIPSIITNVLKIGIELFLMVYISPSLAIALFTFLSFVMFVLAIPVGQYIGVLTKQYQDLLSAAHAAVNEVFQAIRTVQSFSGQHIELQRYMDKIGDPSFSAKHINSGSSSSSNCNYCHSSYCSTWPKRINNNNRMCCCTRKISNNNRKTKKNKKNISISKVPLVSGIMDNSNITTTSSTVPPNSTAYSIGYCRAYAQAGFFTIIFGVGCAGMILSLWYGFHLVVGGYITVGNLTSFQSYLFLIGVSLNELSGQISELMKAQSIAERIFYLLERKPTIPSSSITTMKKIATIIQPNDDKNNNNGGGGIYKINNTNVSLKGNDDDGILIEKSRKMNNFSTVVMKDSSNSHTVDTVKAAYWAAVHNNNNNNNNTPDEESATNMPTHPHSMEGAVDFNNVTFSYPSRPDSIVLKNFSISVPANQTVALVGASGSGKSTCIALLQRFYDVSDGSITVDGHDIRNLDLQWLRSHMAYVQQEPQLFGFSVRENMLYGVNRFVSQQELEDVAKRANAYEFISQWPDKFETLVGERGVQLSGGQKQRIAIARALMRRPRILLLDEATSALDAESEHLVQEAIDKAIVGRTVFIVAHRLSTIQRAQQIVVVDEHRIVDVGTHQELLTRCTKYQELIKRQSISLS